MDKPKTPPQWKPGQTGNPKGRPKLERSAKERAIELVPKAFEALERALARGTTVGVVAAREVLDRAYGKSVATTNVRVIRGLADLSDEELQAIVADTSVQPTATTQEILH